MKKTLFALIGLSLCLSGCGFQLRGQAAAMLPPLQFQCGGSNPFVCGRVRNALQIEGFRLSSNSHWQLTLTASEFSQPLTVTGANDEHRHYDLVHRLQVQLQHNKQRQTRTFTSHRLFTLNSSMILADEWRASQTRHELLDDSIQQLLTFLRQRRA